MAGQIKYEDLFAGDLQKRILDTHNAVKLLLKDLEQIKKGMQQPLKGGYKEYTTQVKDAAEATEDLTRLQKQEISLQQELEEVQSDAGAERLKNIEAMKAQRREATAQAKANKSAKGSMEELAQRLAIARMEFRKLDEQQRKGKGGQKMLKEIQRMDKDIKKLDASIGNHQRNVGDYRQSLRDVGTEFGFMGGAARHVTVALGFVTNGFKTLRLALMSTGIGAIVVALGSLVAYFQGTHEGAVRLQKLLAPLKVTFAVLKDLAADLGEWLYNAFSQPQVLIKQLWEAIKSNIVVRINSVIELFGLLGTAIKQVFAGEWDAAADTAKQAGSVMVDALTGVEDTLEKGGEAWKSYKEFMQQYYDEVKKKTDQEIALIEREAQLERERLKWTVERATLESKIAENRLKAQELQNKNALVGLRHQTQAIELTKQMYERDRELLAEQIRIEAERQSMFDSDLVDQQRLAEMRAELIKLDKSQADGLRELQERYLSLQRAVATAADAAADVSGDVDETIADIDAEITAELEAAEKRDEIAAAQVELEEQKKQATIDASAAAVGAMGDALEALGANAEAVKAIRIAEAIINTYMAASNAFATIPYPANFIAMATAIVAGLANVAQIAGVSIPKYAEGTDYVELNGRPRGRDTIPAMLNEGERVVPADINRMLLGIPNQALPSLLLSDSGRSDKLEQIARQQLMQIAMTNKLLRGGLRYTDHDGSIVDAEGNKKTYVN
jgi:hypothetical protein